MRTHNWYILFHTSTSAEFHLRMHCHWHVSASEYYAIFQVCLFQSNINLTRFWSSLYLWIWPSFLSCRLWWSSACKTSWLHWYWCGIFKEFKCSLTVINKFLHTTSLATCEAELLNFTFFFVSLSIAGTSITRPTFWKVNRQQHKCHFCSSRKAVSLVQGRFMPTSILKCLDWWLKWGTFLKQGWTFWNSDRLCQFKSASRWTL